MPTTQEKRNSGRATPMATYDNACRDVNKKLPPAGGQSVSQPGRRAVFPHGREYD